MEHKKSRITWWSLLLIVLAAVAAVTVTVSALYIKYDKIENTFTPAESKLPTVVEEFNKDVKENVYFTVGDTGYPVYVRAEIVITWKDKDGVVYFADPVKDTDYEIELNDTDWILVDGYYYYVDSASKDVLRVVESGGKTGFLVIKCAPLADANQPDGYTLSVEIIVQTVQAIGQTDGPTNVVDAWQDAWIASLE